MSKEYNNYIKKHKENVAKGFTWMQDNIPDILTGVSEFGAIFEHDDSKYLDDEYDAYDKYFYGGNRSYKVVTYFNKAWLMHIHRNPHHWQHWVLINDEPGEGIVAMDMPYDNIVEMVCDWWAFSWASGKLNEIFDWYEKHEKYMIFSDDTRKSVEHILAAIAEKLVDEATDES